MNTNSIVFNEADFMSLIGSLNAEIKELRSSEAKLRDDNKVLQEKLNESKANELKANDQNARLLSQIQNLQKQSDNHKFMRDQNMKLYHDSLEEQRNLQMENTKLQEGYDNLQKENEDLKKRLGMCPGNFNSFIGMFMEKTSNDTYSEKGRGS